MQEALQHYLPRPLYVLTTIINRIESLGLTPARERALTAAALVACDAGNTMWSPREQTPRPKQLFTPAEFFEHNLWMVMESAHRLWSEVGERVDYAVWPNRLPGSAGVVVYEGRLNLAAELRKEIPIAAVVASVGSRWRGLLMRPFVYGPLYGELMYLIMNFVVMPLSRVGRTPSLAHPDWIVLSVLAHMVFGVVCVVFARRALAVGASGNL